MAANGWSADVDCAFREPTSSTDGQTLNKRTFFGDDDDERNTDADSLIHSILNENAAERMDEIVDTTPSNPLVDLTDADDLLQSFCSAIGDRPSGTDDDADGALTPLTSIDPLLSSTAAPSTPLVPLGVHAKRSIAISTPAAVGTADTQGTKKLINQLTRMNKHNLKQMINNPDGKYATALQTQARRKNREETRKQLRIISSMDTTAVGDVEADEGVDSSSIPSDIFEQIGRVLNVDFSETFPPCDAVAAAVFEPNAALCGDENDFLMERLAEAERAFDADDVVVSDAVATDGSFAGAASDATPSNEQGVAAISIDATLGKTSTMTTTETSVGVTVPPAATGIASSNRQPKDAILLTTEQPSAAEPRNKKNAANIRKIKQIWSWKNNTLKLKKIQFGTELSEDLLKSAIEAKNVERVLILRMIGNTQLGKHLLAGVYTNLPEYTLNNFRATERSFARYKPGCEWELQKEKLDSRRKAKQARLDLKQQSDTLPAHSRKILTLPQLRQLWSAKKQKNAIISQQLLPTLRQSAIDATAEERRHILDHVRVKFRNRLLADHFLNLPELTLKEFQTEERGLARYEPNCEWEQRYQKVCKKNAQREAKQATARFAETASLDLQPNTPEISAIALPQTHDADPPINQTDGNSSKTDYTTTIESDTRPSPVQRSTTITSEATSTSGPKHIRFDEPLAECESAHIAHQPLTTAPAAEPQAATNVPETPTAVPTLVQHTRFDDAADVTITIDDLSQPEPSSTNTESEVSSPPETAPEAAPETAVPTVDSALPAPNSPPASTAPDPTTDVAVVSPLQPAKTAATAARTAATFVECDDGRFAQRLSSTSAELRQTLKQVPKHIRSAISKRLKELNANERRAKRGSQSTSVQSDDDLEEEDVIDVTPATPSVDLTAGDDVDDAGGEIAAATTTPRIPEVVQSSVTIVVPPEPTVPTADSAITDAVPATEPNAAIITTTPATVDSPVPAAIETVSSANVPIPTTTEPVLPPATPSLPPAVIVRTPSPKVVVRTPTPTAIVRTPTPNAIVRTPTPAAIVRTPTPVAEKTRSTPKTSTIPEKKPTEPTDKPNSKSSTSSKSKTKPESNLPVASKTKASVKSTTKSQSRDTSREPPVVGERPSKTTTSSDQRHGCSPGEKKFVVPAKAAASASTGASSASTVPRMPLPIGADPHRTTSSKHSTGKSSVARAVPASDPAVVGKVTVLQRMKEIDRLLVNSMQKKMSIDQQIVELQQKKSDIESAQMRWHEERSQLLASLINGDSSSSSNTAEKKRPAKVPTSTTTAKAKAASTATSNPIISEQISTVAISTIKTESGSSNAGKSTKKRPANGTPIADPVKRRRIKRTIDLTDGDAELDSAARRLFVVGPQLDHILRNPGVVQLARLNIDVIQDAVPDPAIPQLPPIEVSTSDETSLSDGGSQDDASFDGCFFGNRLVIVYVLVIGRYLLAASEDGNVYKYVWRTGEMVATFAQHSQTVTSLVQTAPATILSISLDGFVRQFQLKVSILGHKCYSQLDDNRNMCMYVCLQKFEQQVEAFSVGEPLQTIVYNWNTAFVGCKSGKIAVLHRSEEVTRPVWISIRILTTIPPRHPAEPIPAGHAAAVHSGHDRHVAGGDQRGSALRADCGCAPPRRDRARRPHRSAVAHHCAAGQNDRLQSAAGRGRHLLRHQS